MGAITGAIIFHKSTVTTPVQQQLKNESVPPFEHALWSLRLLDLVEARSSREIPEVAALLTRLG
jgi:hypothetical protein